MKKLLVFVLVASLLLVSQIFARSAFEEAVDTAIESKKAEQEGRRSSFPGPVQPQEEREKFLKDINEKIPTPTPKIEKKEINQNKINFPAGEYRAINNSHQKTDLLCWNCRPDGFCRNAMPCCNCECEDKSCYDEVRCCKCEEKK
jgi:hypothetical protein